MASNTPRSGSDRTLISGEPKDSTIFIVSSVEAPSTTSISLSGWVWRRNDSIVNAIVACELKVVVTTLIFIACSARTFFDPHYHAFYWQEVSLSCPLATGSAHFG